MYLFLKIVKNLKLMKHILYLKSVTQWLSTFFHDHLGILQKSWDSIKELYL